MPQVVEREKSLIYMGKLKDLTLPSTQKFILKEANGEDEELLSNLGLVDNSQNVHAYLGNVLLNSEHKPIGRAAVSKFKIQDKYVALLESRILNHGPKLEFTHKCLNTNCRNSKIEQPYEEDLRCYSMEEFDPKDKVEKSLSIPKAYPNGEAIQSEFEIDGQKFRITHLTSVKENTLRNLSVNSQSKNTILLVRDLEKMDENGQWVKVTFFTMFSANFMGRLRKKVTELDPEFDPKIEVICPECKVVQEVPLWGIPNFYYPGEQ